MHFTVCRAREGFAKRPIGAEELLCVSVVQDDRGAPDL